MKARSPWAWVPTVYMFEGLPNAIVNTVSLIVFKNMGMPNDRLTLYTSLLSFPWILKIVLSPMVDTVGRKRNWAAAMQVLMVLCTLALGIVLPKCALSLILVLFLVTAFASSIHDIAADGFYMLGLDDHTQSLFVGVRNTFFRLALLCGQGLLAIVAGVIQNNGGDAVASWSWTLMGCSAVMAAFALWDIVAMPRPAADSPRKNASGADSFKDLGNLFVSFITKPGIVAAVVFMLLYRLPEAFSIKMLIPFLKDAREVGGLGMNDVQVGLANGTIGVIALLLGGILGGIAGGRWGLRRCLIPMALSLALPCAVYLYLALAQPNGVLPVYICIAVDQFGYGFGFTAYTLFMLYFSRGQYQTSHYAFCTVLMTFSMMLPGLVAGKIQMAAGYPAFFGMVMVCCMVTVAVTLMIRKKTDPDYGKK
ncbi:MAG: MFS transporter [Bacteroidales bacterium]|nr:MFS transporter [Candidatus Cryptobacteroides onthequi]